MDDMSFDDKYKLISVDGEEFICKKKAWAEKQSDMSLELKMKQNNIPLHAKNLVFENYIGTDRTFVSRFHTFCEKFDEKFYDKHLYLWSKEHGTQKTTMASIIAKELLKKGKSVRFTLMGDLISLLSKLDTEDDEQVKSMQECDFLVVDDSFDKKKCTIYRSGYQLGFLDRFLRQRLEVDRKATCFTSNMSPDSIESECFGDNLKTLIQRSCIPFEMNVSYDEINRFDPDDLWS